ncbi:MAG: hypothetical protein JWM42_27, partial [Burkholderia sp.]|nr:hypothetical protein [Burkholderia sp.]
TDSEWRFRLHLAVAILVPVRPADMAGCNSVIIENVDGILKIIVRAAKSRSGLAGTGTSTILIDPNLALPAASFLAEACSDGPIGVRLEAKDEMRKPLQSLAKRALAGCSVNITPYVLRAQTIADLKKTFGAGEEVAIAASHGSDKTQAYYGRCEHGRGRRGYLSFHATRKPRTGNVQRAAQLSAGRKLLLSHWS